MEHLLFNNCLSTNDLNDKILVTQQFKDDIVQENIEFLNSPKSENQFFSNELDFKTNILDEGDNAETPFSSHIFEDGSFNLGLDENMGLGLSIEHELNGENETNRTHGTNLSEKRECFMWNNDNNSFNKPNLTSFDGYVHQKKICNNNNNNNNNNSIQNYQYRPRRPDSIMFHSSMNHTGLVYPTKSPESTSSSEDSAIVDSKTSPSSSSSTSASLNANGNNNNLSSQYSQNSLLFRTNCLINSNYSNNHNVNNSNTDNNVNTNNFNNDRNHFSNYNHTNSDINGGSSFNSNTNSHHFNNFSTNKYRTISNRLTSLSSNSVAIGYNGSKLFQSPIPQSGLLLLTEEEKRTMLVEGFTVPTRLPLTKQEERNLKKVRRKIKNKISAQESRRKKKEYMEALEKKVDYYAQENNDLKRQLDNQESMNRSLLGQLRHMQQMVVQQQHPHRSSGTHKLTGTISNTNSTNNHISNNSTASNTTTTTCLMICCLCFTLLFASSNVEFGGGCYGKMGRVGIYGYRSSGYYSVGKGAPSVRTNKLYFKTGLSLEPEKSRLLINNIHKVGYGRINQVHNPSTKMQRYRSFPTELVRLFNIEEWLMQPTHRSGSSIATNNNRNDTSTVSTFVLCDGQNKTGISGGRQKDIKDKGILPVDSYYNVPFTNARQSVLLENEDESCAIKHHQHFSYFLWLFPYSIPKESCQTNDSDFDKSDNYDLMDSYTINHSTDLQPQMTKQPLIISHAITKIKSNSSTNQYQLSLLKQTDSLKQLSLLT